MAKNRQIGEEMSLEEYRALAGKTGYVMPLHRPSVLSENPTAAEYQKEQQKRKPRNDAEHRMQCEIVSDFDRDYPALAGLLFAIPNGSAKPSKTIVGKDGKKKEYSLEALKMRAEGVRRGIADLMLPVARGGWHGLFIENKVLPNQPSPEQRCYMERFTEQGYYCVVCYTREQAKEIFHNYLSL